MLINVSCLSITVAATEQLFLSLSVLFKIFPSLGFIIFSIPVVCTDATLPSIADCLCQHCLTFSVCLQCHLVLALQLYVVRLVSESICMEMLKIEQVIVGDGMRSTSPETKPESDVIPPQSCK